MSYSRTYKSWQCMKQRCLNENNPNYPNYGGRGIGIDPRWIDSFEYFHEDMGTRPKGCQLDREDNDGDYYIENCRWIPSKMNSQNTRVSMRWFIRGNEFQSSRDAARALGVSDWTIRNWCKNEFDCYSEMVYYFPEGTDRSDGYDFMEGL